MKVVINACFGGFGLSKRALREMGMEYWEYEHPRNDPKLVELVERLGPEANGDFAELKIVEIPDGVDFVIQEYDGSEHIAERHRTWR